MRFKISPKRSRKFSVEDRLILLQEIFIDHLLKQRKFRKDSHWAWYIFPTDKRGRNDPAKTRVGRNRRSLIDRHSERADNWGKLLTKIANSVNEKDGGVEGFERVGFSSEDIGRIEHFLDFWKDYVDERETSKHFSRGFRDISNALENNYGRRKRDREYARRSEKDSEKDRRRDREYARRSEKDRRRDREYDRRIERRERSGRVIEIATLRDCYSRGYAFPLWVENLRMNDWNEDTLVFYDKGGLRRSSRMKDTVWKIVCERELVNLGMRRKYDKKKFAELLRTSGYTPYSKGGYGSVYQQYKKLPPNIAIYSPTPIVYGRRKREIAHVINLVGLAFDNKDQPDFKVCIAMQKDKRVDWMKKRYKLIWEKAFLCAKKLRKTLVYSGVGSGAFLYYLGISNLTFYERIILPILKTLKEQYRDVKIVLAGPKPSYKIPNILFDQKKLRSLTKRGLKDLLWVNAWDPWSLVGNGNERDASLDGHWGRISALGVLCWPLTNKKMEKSRLIEIDK